MKLNQLILSLFVNLAIVLFISINANANAKDKNSVTIKPICLSEECFGENDSDIIVFDPTFLKIKTKDINNNRLTFDALSHIAFGAKINVYYSVQIITNDLHIINRQLLL